MSENDNRANEVADPAEEKRTVVGGEGVDTGDNENYTVDKNEGGSPAGGAADNTDAEPAEPGTPVTEVHPDMPDPS